jgi:hypothetical protein
MFAPLVIELLLQLDYLALKSSQLSQPCSAPERVQRNDISKVIKFKGDCPFIPLLGHISERTIRTDTASRDKACLAVSSPTILSPYLRAETSGTAITAREFSVTSAEDSQDLSRSTCSLGHMPVPRCELLT